MKAKNIYKKFEFSIKEVNRTFMIKAYSNKYNGKKLNRLLGVSGLIKLIGVKLANKLLHKAFNCKEDKAVFRLRRGLIVTFLFH